MQEKYTTRELLKIVQSLGSGTDGFNDRLKDWHRRGGIVPGEPTGRGNERQYTFEDLVYVASLALFADHARFLGAAILAAKAHARAVIEIYATGPDGDVVDRCPAQLIRLTENSPQFEIPDFESAVTWIVDQAIKLGGEAAKLGADALATMVTAITKAGLARINRRLSRHPADGLVLVHPGNFALRLLQAIEDVLAQREGYTNARDRNEARKP